jgi:hypothetical protein
VITINIRLSREGGVCDGNRANRGVSGVPKSHSFTGWLLQSHHLKIIHIWTEGVAQVVDNLPNRHETLHSSPGSTKKKMEE